MLAMLRVKRARSPLALSVKISPMLRALEVQRVGAGLAFDGVVAVARVPVEAVVAGAEGRGVGALVAVDEVVAGAAEQDVGAVAAAQDVVAVAAVERELGERGDVAGRGEAVVAVAARGQDALDVDRLGVAEAGEGAVGDEVERVGAVGADEGHAVDRAGAVDAQGVGAVGARDRHARGHALDEARRR